MGKDKTDEQILQDCIRQASYKVCVTNNAQNRMILDILVEKQIKLESENKVVEKYIATVPRVEVVKFADAMEVELKENEYKGGWKDCTIEFLANKLDEEVDELMEAVSNGLPDRVLSEAADIGNIAMMIADIYDALK